MAASAVGSRGSFYFTFSRRGREMGGGGVLVSPGREESRDWHHSPSLARDGIRKGNIYLQQRQSTISVGSRVEERRGQLAIYTFPTHGHPAQTRRVGSRIMPSLTGKTVNRYCILDFNCNICHAIAIAVEHWHTHTRTLKPHYIPSPRETPPSLNIWRWQLWWLAGRVRRGWVGAFATIA